MGASATDYPMFSSRDLELLFFDIAPAYEIVKYVDFASRFQVDGSLISELRQQWRSSNEIDEILYRRNDSAIDIATARIGSPEAILRILERHKLPDAMDSELQRSSKLNIFSKVILSAVQNRVSLSHFFEPQPWLREAWPWILKHGIDDHFRKLFLNPDLPSDILIGVFAGEYDQDARDKCLLYYVALGAPLLSKRPNDTRSGPDLHQHLLQQAFWRFLATVDTNDKCVANAIQNNVDNFPHDVEFDQTVLRFPEHGDRPHPPQARGSGILSYLDVIISHWEPSQADEADDFVVWSKNDIIENVTVRIVRGYDYDEKVVGFMRGHPNIAVRKGFYRGYRFGQNSKEELERYVETDNYEFFLSAVENNAFYNWRNNKELCGWLFHKIRWNSPDTADKNYEEKYEKWERLIVQYERHANELHAKTSDTLPDVFPPFGRLEELILEWKAD